MFHAIDRHHGHNMPVKQSATGKVGSNEKPETTLMGVASKPAVPPTTQGPTGGPVNATALDSNTHLAILRYRSEAGEAETPKGGDGGRLHHHHHHHVHDKQGAATPATPAATVAATVAPVVAATVAPVVAATVAPVVAATVAPVVAPTVITAATTTPTPNLG